MPRCLATRVSECEGARNGLQRMGVEQFGLRVLTPREFLRRIEEEGP
jgi:hypothetical protein